MISNVFTKKSGLLKKQVVPLFLSTRKGGLANIFAVWLVYSLVSNSNQQADALILGATISILSLIRIFVSEFYLKKVIKLELVLNLYFILTLLIGCSWGLFAVLQSTESNEAIRNMVFLINFGMIAGSLATLSIWIPAYIAYVAPQALGIFTVLAIQGTSLSMYFAFAFAVFILIMFADGLSFHRSFKRELILKDKLKESRRDLKKKVIERTKELEIINLDLSNEIEEKKVIEENLEFIAYHDELTQLPRKNLLIDRISTAIASAERSDNRIAVLFLDLDRFKSINDSLGHLIGDMLIIDVSKRLQLLLRKEDTISRNGGDEFVVVLKGIKSASEPVLVAEKIINTLASSFSIESHTVNIGVSIGISLFPDDGCTALDLLRDADTAMMNAKKKGGNRYIFYKESMSSILREKLEIETQLRSAIEDMSFNLVYQPQVDLESGETIGFEALLRWEDKKLGNVSPSEFVPVLEDTGLIYRVGEWVIKTVISTIAAGKTNNIPVSINLSALQCNDKGLLYFISKQILNYGIKPNLVEFEITESILINDIEKTEFFLNELHTIGCSIALDDFGTGYTSMTYLARLPIDVIKVDQSFVRGIDSNTRLENIVKAIIYMSKSLGMKNVFEGLENIKELEIIKRLEGKYIQGYYYSKPLTLNEMRDWLNPKVANKRLLLSVTQKT